MSKKHDSSIYTPAGLSARRSQRRPATGWHSLKENWKTHLVILLLAFVIWWTVKQGVDTVLVIEDRVRLEAVLDDELNGEYSLLANPSLAPAIRAVGPHKEISRFQELLNQWDKSPAYRYSIGPSDVATLTPDRDGRMILRIPISRFDDTTNIPHLREVSVDFAKPATPVEVVLERRMSIPAVFDMHTAVVVPEAYHAIVTMTTPSTQASGPWSRLKPYSTSGNPQRSFRFVTRDMIAELREQLLNKAPEEQRALLAAPRVLNLGIQPMEGIEFHDGEGHPITTIGVNVTFEEQSDFVLERRDIPIDILQPHWMLEKHASISQLDQIRTLAVELLIDPARRDQFNAENVRLILDLRNISPELGRPSRHDRDTRMINVNVPVRLEVNREKFPCRIPERSGATELRFHAYDLTLLWNE